MGIARKPAAEETQPADELAGEAQDLTPDPIPLALAPLVAPYKRRGRVRLRIERLPRHARLSQGQNNGDGSWSLMLDELEDLKYLPPKGSTEASVLSIRILSVEHGDATTLAVQDYALPAPTRSGAAGAATSHANKTGDDAELRRLRSELAKAQSALSLRESELVAAQRDAEEARSEVSRQAIDREIAAARAAWEEEFERRLASAASDKSGDLQKNRESWRRETEAALARAEREWKAAEAERSAAAESQWKERASRSVAQLRAEAETLRKDNAELAALREKADALRSALSGAQEELAKARAEAAATEDRARKSLSQSRAEADVLRSDGAELEKLRQKAESLQSALEKREAEFAKLRAESAEGEARAKKDLERARADAVSFRSEGAELGTLRQKIGALQSALDKREAEFAKLRAESAEGDARAKKDLERARAEATSLRSESAELGTLRQKIGSLQSALDKREAEFSKLRAESAEAEADAKRDLERARAEAHTLRGDEGELGRLRERLNRLQASLDLRDRELVQARADVVEAENRGHKDVEAALARAEKTWKAEEGDRLQTAEARWKEQASRAQAETRSHVKDRDDEVRRLRNDLERAQKAIAEREAAEKDAHGSAADARLQAKRTLEEALSKADNEKNAIEARWQEQFAQAVGAVTAQLGRSEKALADARAEIASLRGGDSEIERLRAEHADLKGSLAEQENALRRARAAVEEARARGKNEMEEALARAESLWQSNEAARLVAAEKRWREQSRDAMDQSAAQAQRAEAALTKLHAQDEALRNRSVEYQRSRDECAALRDALAQRENELAQVRWTLIQTRERKASDVEPSPVPARTEQIWSAETLQKLNRPIGVPRDRLFDPHNTLGEPEPEVEQAPPRRMGRDLVVVMILAVIVVAGAIRFAPDSWWAAIMPASTQSQKEPEKQQAVPAAQPATTPDLPETTVARSANLRSGPAKTADAVATLPKGTKVVVVAHHGNWVQIRSVAEDAKHKALEGWVFNTFLSDTAPTAAAKSP